ncbi:MAG TPA: DMT family transporter [Candidatus Xenobia bacterium]|jgi:drug/metabolite transporter (DMT)-like permease
MLALLLVGSALTHAVWNALLKRQPSPQQATVGVTVYSGLAALLMGGSALWSGNIPAPAWHWGLGAGCMETAYFFTLGVALEAAPLSVVYPVVRGAAVILVWPVSLLVTGEGLNLSTTVGAGLVVAGLWLAGGGGHLSRRGLGAGLAAAVCVAFNHVAYRAGIAGGSPPTTIFALSMTVAMTLSLAREGGARLRTAWKAGIFSSPAVVLSGVLASVSFLLALAAMQSAGAGRVLTLRNLSIPFSVLLGWAGGERPTRPQVMGALLVTAGACLIR